MRTDKEHLHELTAEELDAEAAEALPERPAMSTLNVTGLDTAGAAVEAVGDGTSAPPEPVPVPAETGAAEAAQHGPPATIPAAEHSATAAQHVPPAAPESAATGSPPEA